MWRRLCRFIPLYLLKLVWNLKYIIIVVDGVISVNWTYLINDLIAHVTCIAKIEAKNNNGNS